MALQCNAQRETRNGFPTAKTIDSHPRHLYHDLLQSFQALDFTPLKPLGTT